MIESQLKIVVVGVIFTVLWVMFFTIHRNYHIALTRQRLFVIRASVFNAALEGEISFNDPAYELVRQALNGMIRFTHNLSFLRWFAIVMLNRYVHKDLQEHFNAQFNQALDKLSNDQKLLLLRALANAHWQIVRHLMSISLLWVLFKPVSIVFGWVHKTQSARRWAMKGPNRTEQWRRFDAEATYNSYNENGDCGYKLAA